MICALRGTLSFLSLNVRGYSASLALGRRLEGGIGARPTTRRESCLAILPPASAQRQGRRYLRETPLPKSEGEDRVRLALARYAVDRAWPPSLAWLEEGSLRGQLRVSAVCSRSQPSTDRLGKPSFFHWTRCGESFFPFRVEQLKPLPRLSPLRPGRSRASTATQRGGAPRRLLRSGRQDLGAKGGRARARSH